MIVCIAQNEDRGYPLLSAKDGRFHHESVKVIGKQAVVVFLSGGTGRRRKGLGKNRARIEPKRFAPFGAESREAGSGG